MRAARRQGHNAAVWSIGDENLARRRPLADPDEALEAVALRE
jgi:hypothetical protein